jgi:predicted nucleic acid-binding protein
MDTSALMVFLDGDDARHGEVVAAFAELAGDELVTHGYVVAESLAVTRRRLGVEVTASLLDEVLPLQRYRTALPTATSFVDHVSLAVIGREAITTVFALDPDLGTPGVRLVSSDEAAPSARAQARTPH